MVSRGQEEERKAPFPAPSTSLDFPYCVHTYLITANQTCSCIPQPVPPDPCVLIVLIHSWTDMHKQKLLVPIDVVLRSRRIHSVLQVKVLAAPQDVLGMFA